MLRALLATAAALTLADGALAAAPRPNIIFVLTDDLGWGDLGVYFQNSRNFTSNRNSPALATPGLDAMAAQGLRMDRHYTPAPVCAPARASLLLGVHQGHANVRDNQFDKELAHNHTLATTLRHAGYATAAIGKWGLQGGPGYPGHPLHRGFDYFFGYMAHLDAHYHYPKEQGRAYYENFTNISDQLDKSYSTDLATARSKKWISDHRTAQPDRPFFLFLAYAAPHAQLNVPTGPYPAGGGAKGGVQWTGTPGAVINTASGTTDAWIHPDYANATWDHDNNPATAELPWPATARRHATMVRRLDDAMTDLFQFLSDLEIDDNTLVVFTSDNGPHNEAGSGGGAIGAQDPQFFRSYGPLDGIKRDVWEGGIRVPTLVRWPRGIPAGRVSTHPSQFHDWLPTFAELAGLPAPFRSDGVSLLPDLTGTGTQREGVVYVEYAVSGSTPTYPHFHTSHRGATRNQMQALFLGGYKGVRYNTTAANTPFRVHDTLADPQETENLAGRPGVPSQADFEARAARIRRPEGSAPRVYDSAEIPSINPVEKTPNTILRTHFDSRTLSATTASGFAWTSDLGEQGSATTSLAFTGSATGFIDGYTLGSGALNPPGQPIPVAGNIESSGPWSTSFQFTPLASHPLASVEITAYAISATGGHQATNKNIRFEVTIQGGSLNRTAEATGDDPGGNGALVLPIAFPPTTLEAGTTYTITLTANSPAPSGGNNLALNSIALTAASPAIGVPESMKPGLRFAAYEGSFPWVPDFTSQAPAKSGESAGIDLSGRTRNDDIGMVFEGFIQAPASGTYNFFLTTDTGAFVRLHDAQLIDADFGHSPNTEKSSGSIQLAAGLHPIRIHYRHTDAATHSLNLQWQGPGIPKQPVPDDKFFIQGEPDPAPPTAHPDETSAVSGVPTSIAVLKNDNPGFGPQPLTLTTITQPANGSASIANNNTSVTYTSHPGYLGPDSFSYTVTNGAGNATTTVTIDVVDAIPPTASDDVATTSAATPLTIPVLANDSPGGGPGPLVIQSAGSPAGGSVSITGDSITYTPRASFRGTDSFPYTISDGLKTASATVTVTVHPPVSTLWLPFDESSGNTAHDALGRPLGTLTGFNGPGWTPGRIGGALRFFADGDADRVVLTGNKGVTGTAARTISFWIHADADQAGVRSTLVSWGASNSSTAGVRFDINLNHTTGYRLRAEFNASGVNFTTPARADLRGTGWVHCAIVVPQNATVAQVLGYLDGQPATPQLEPSSAGATSINTGNTHDLSIGNWATDNTRPFRGIIDDLRIYPRVLDPAEIAALASKSSTQSLADAWFFGHSGNDLPLAADWQADTDGDGLPAILEFALGGNPTTSSRSVAPVLTAGRDFVFNRRQAALPALAYTVEQSTDLRPGSWLPLEIASVVPHPTLTGFDQVRAPLPPAAGPRTFLRLRVDTP
jgi:arylsulfatase A-like enzyme